MQNVWYRKYQPSSLDGYVFNDENIEKQVKQWINNKEIPHLLLTGDPGTGKTTLAKILVNELGIDDIDVLFISASLNNKIEVLRDKIVDFVNKGSFYGNGRIVILDEADKLAKSYQDSLRNLIGESDDVEDYRFILLGNYEHKFIPALKSRLAHIKFGSMPKNDYMCRLIDIIDSENITVNDEQDFMNIVDKCYPDLRSGIKNLELATIDGVLTNHEIDDTVADWMIDSLTLFQSGKITEGRKMILDNISYEEFTDYYKFLFEHIDLIFEGKPQTAIDAAIITIRDAEVYDSQVANREINLSACLAKLNTIYSKT